MQIFLDSLNNCQLFNEYPNQELFYYLLGLHNNDFILLFGFIVTIIVGTDAVVLLHLLLLSTKHRKYTPSCTGNILIRYPNVPKFKVEYHFICYFK
jgi:hypothetical protein